MKERANQIGLPTCPELFYGKLQHFLEIGNRYIIPGSLEEKLSIIFYNELLEKPSILDNSVIEEGFCIRVDKYPKPYIFKIKSKKFLLHESGDLDKNYINLESEN